MFLVAREQLKVAREMNDRMSQAFGHVGDQLKTLTEHIGDLQAEIRDEWSGATELESRVTTAYEEALVFAETWCVPWIGPLEAADALVGRMVEPLAVLEVRLASLEPRVPVIRAAMGEAAGDPAALRALRDDFSGLSGELWEACGELQRLGLAEESSLPSNPFEGRRLKDRRVL